MTMVMADKTRYPYCEDFVIRGFECDPNEKLRLSVLWRFMQEVATNHLGSLGLDFEKLVSDGIVFLLTDVSLKINRLPVFGEKVSFCTCPAITKGTRMLREVIAVSEAGELLCEFQTAWVPVNPFTHKILRPTSFTHTLPQLEVYSPFCDVAKIKVDAATEEVSTRTVRVSDLDKNHHLNNTVYLDIIADAIGEEYLSHQFDEVHIKYKNEGKLEDKMTLYKTNSDGEILVSGSFDDRVCFISKLILKI